MTVSATVNGTTSTFTDQVGGCSRDHAPYAAVLIYATAISGNGAALTALEQRLR
jgi:hypothetical protein